MGESNIQGKNMIYLIGGAPRCGKSTLAKKLAQKKRISYVSTDSLRPVIKKYISKKELYKKLPFEKAVEKVGYNCDALFSEFSLKENLQIDIVEAQTMGPGIAAFIGHQIYNKQDYVIEGVHLFPEIVKLILKDKLVKKNTKIVYLVKTDQVKILKGLKKNKAKQDWLLSASKKEETLVKAAEWISAQGKYIKKEAKKHKYKVVEMDDDFNKKIAKLARQL